jgi:hypothetical protein
MGCGWVYPGIVLASDAALFVAIMEGAARRAKRDFDLAVSHGRVAR